MTDWVRLWHDMPTDPKWRVVARKSGQPLAAVIAVFTMMLTSASGNAAKRGALNSWDNEDIAAALDMEPDAIKAIYDAMQGKVLDGDELTGWSRRQPKREDSGVSERVRKHRETKIAETERDETQRNAPETETETETDKKNDAAHHLGAHREPVSEAVVVWNETAAIAGWPQVARLSASRRDATRNRLREHRIDGWRAAIERARASPYLGGSDPPSWFTFDWLAKAGNFLKVIEGNYDRRMERNDWARGGQREPDAVRMLREAEAELALEAEREAQGCH